MAERPEAQAELRVRDGPVNLYLTPKVAAGMLVRICSIDSLLTF
jgi:hypothetical protein